MLLGSKLNAFGLEKACSGVYAALLPNIRSIAAIFAQHCCVTCAAMLQQLGFVNAV